MSEDIIVKCAGCKSVMEEDDIVRCDECHRRKLDAAADDAFEQGKDEGHKDAVGDVRQSDLMDLAKGIREGDKDRADTALDIIAEHFGWGEIIAKGRASRASATTPY